MDDTSTFEYVDVDWDIIVRQRKSGAATGKGIAGQVGWRRLDSTAEVPRVEHVTIDVKEEDHITLLKEKLELYKDDYVKPYWDIISKVPEKLRKVNEEAYAPRVVSIGPRHHAKPHLQPMERYKWSCLNRYLERSNLDLESISLAAMKNEARIRLLFQDRCAGISPEELSQMIMLDCVFMIELFMDNNNDLVSNKIIDDPWIKGDVLHDLMLLENQLPYEILCDMFQARVPSGTFSLDSLIHNYFKSVGFMDRLPQKELTCAHLVEFLRSCHRPRFSTLRRASRKGKPERCRSAMELLEAGAQFVPSMETDNYLHVEFNTKGKLIIPRLKVDEWTETFFRNLIAFEQCRRSGTQYITSFMLLMNSLLQTTKDVNILVQAGVIENAFGDNERVWEIFSNLHREITLDNKEYYFAHLCEGLNNYNKNRYHQWKATWFRWKRVLSRDYFSTPWSIISVIGGAALLALTATQTAYAIKAYPG